MVAVAWIAHLSCASPQDRTTEGGFEPKPQGAPVGHSNQEFWIQPYQDSRLTVYDEPVPFKILEKDKSMARVVASLPLYSSNPKNRVPLAIHHPQYRTQVFSVSTPTSDSGLAHETSQNLFALHPPESRFSFVRTLKTGRQPKSVRFLDERRVVVPLLEDDGIDIIDIHSGESVRIRPPQEYAVKTGFVESLVIPRHNQLWVSQMHTNSVHVFDLKSLDCVKTISLKGRFTKVLLYDPRADLVYASNWLSENISLLDPTSLTEIRTTPNVGLPRGLHLSRDGKSLYVAQFAADNKTDGGGKLGIYSIEKQAFTDLLGPPGSKRHIAQAPDGPAETERIYASDMCCATVELYDIKTKQVIKSIPTYHKPNTIVLSPDSQHLYVSTRGANHPTKGFLHKGLDLGKIFVIDTATNAVLESWEAGNQPTGLDISPNGEFLVSSDFLDHRIRIYRRNQ